MTTSFPKGILGRTCVNRVLNYLCYCAFSSVFSSIVLSFLVHAYSFFGGDF